MLSHFTIHLNTITDITINILYNETCPVLIIVSVFTSVEMIGKLFLENLQ